MVQPKRTINDDYSLCVAASWNLFESVLWTEEVALPRREIQLRERLRNDEVCNYTRVHLDFKQVLNRGQLSCCAVLQQISLWYYLFNSHSDKVLANMFGGCLNSENVN